MATIAAASGEEVAQASDFVARLLQEAENRFGMHAPYSPYYLVDECIKVGHVDRPTNLPTKRKKKERKTARPRGKKEQLQESSRRRIDPSQGACGSGLTPEERKRGREELVNLFAIS